MLYDLTDLKVFLAVAEEGNLSRGAERCSLAPSSVSLRIKGLEETLGTPLLIRQSRGVSLTPAGHVLVEHARRCMAQLAQMTTDLQPFANGLIGHVTFFANNNAISRILIKSARTVTVPVLTKRYVDAHAESHSQYLVTQGFANA